ncbi:MAG: F0F1 ATP synthase subunit epsilon [Bacteroidetes bacterium]|nr:F0F1 ATP synthase subunit epsilon [Bacteroidota bacterium]
MMNTTITLKVLLPYKVLVEVPDVKRLTVETTSGSVGFLPNRLDCAAALVPGILMYENSVREVKYLALDEGLLLKTGGVVTIAVRNAVAGSDLGRLRQSIESDLRNLEDRERDVRNTLAKLETGFFRSLEKFRQAE